MNRATFIGRNGNIAFLAIFYRKECGVGSLVVAVVARRSGLRKIHGGSPDKNREVKYFFKNNS